MKKIVAVIPARAGSKGVPNKNIRLVAGKPLVYYAIKNALDSKFVTQVIVTTDSPEVMTIAEKLGATVRQRDEILCGDAVTLDSVIYDAVKDLYNLDYVVTMQPTSPSLKVSTLDDAIDNTITKDVDTTISVVNTPHLSWSLDKDNQPIPNYKERLNRQYLPAHFSETGAFVISKASVVTETSRIGKTVSVYEIAENESIDIDTFNELRLVENLLSENRVAIYVNGNNKRGTGHIYRALEIADEFFVKPDIYYDIHQTNPNIFGGTTHNLIGVDGISELFSRIKDIPYNLFINDILNTSIDYMIALKNALPNTKIVNFEDDGEGIIKSDLVFNALYSQSDLVQVKSGEKYYIAPKLFMLYEPIKIKESVEKVFISFGGADPQNYSDILLDIISKPEYRLYKFIVVLGRAKHNVNELLTYNKFEHISVYYDVRNMPKLMSECDIAITSRGRTGYELAMLGIPSIAMAQNAREEKHGFVCNENGFSYIGLEPSQSMIKGTLDIYLNLNKEEREHYQRILLSHNLKNGRKRVMNLINGLIED